jgi:hypothetical protein
MKKLIFMLLFATGPATAGQIYKCTNQNGTVGFQSIPCDGKAAAEQIDLPANSTSGYQAPAPTSNNAEIQESIDQFNADRAAAQERYERRIEEIDQNHCQYYQDRLADLEERWGKIRRSGYQQWERDMWESHISSRERDVDRECN